MRSCWSRAHLKDEMKKKRWSPQRERFPATPTSASWRNCSEQKMLRFGQEGTILRQGGESTISENDVCRHRRGADARPFASPKYGCA